MLLNWWQKLADIITILNVNNGTGAKIKIRVGVESWVTITRVLKTGADAGQGEEASAKTRVLDMDKRWLPLSRCQVYPFPAGQTAQPSLTSLKAPVGPHPADLRILEHRLSDQFNPAKYIWH